MYSLQQGLLVSLLIASNYGIAQTTRVTLAKAYQAALGHNKETALQDEQIKQAEERYRQALGAIFPSIAVVGNYLQQEHTKNTVTPSYQPLTKIMLTQPLFHGLRDLRALDQTKINKSIQTQSKSLGQMHLYRDVAQAYYNILAIESDLKNYTLQMQSYRSRISEIKSRIKIGRSRRSEVLTVEAAQAGLAAQIARSRGALAAARLVFVFLTGLDSKISLATVTALPPSLQPLTTYLNHGLKRPEITLSDLKVSSADTGIALARGSHAPSVDFTANYYLQRYQRNVNWDVGLAINIPIFGGGITSSKVREAHSQKTAAQLAASQAREEVVQNIRGLYETIESDLEQLARLAESKEIYARHMSELQTEYRLNLTTNSDVLLAITSYQEAVRAWEWAKFSSQLDYLKLLIASGQQPL